jgi:hypothetical protein
MATATISQAAERVNLAWTEGDPVSLTATVTDGAGWAGTYDIESETTEIAALTATVVADGADAVLTITSAGACLLAAGSYYWRLQQVGGVTRLRGRVVVD